jgi:hypothetical protein
MKLAETLGTLPSGRVVALSDSSLQRYLKTEYVANKAEAERQELARKRLAYYYDEAGPFIEELINRIFKNQRVRDWRKELVPFANYQNLTRRIVREISTVYSEPAIRSVRNANERYRTFQRVVMQDRRMRNVNRMLNLLNEVLIQFRFRTGKAEPVIDIITPDRFWAVAAPNDPTEFVAAIIETFPTGPNVSDQSPHYIVIAAEENYILDKNCHVIAVEEHGYPLAPIILAHRDPREDRLLDMSSGSDLISAHDNLALLNVLALKAQKAGTKLAYATGDTSSMARGQPMDDEGLLEAPEGVNFDTLDLGANPDSYITAARAVIKQIAANYGIPESVFDLSYQATSGFEIELKRVGLREIRQEQVLDYRPMERAIAQLESDLLTRANHSLKFDTAGWTILFGDVETPADPMSKLEYYEKLERMGLANRVEVYMWQNPEVTELEAKAAVLKNIELRIEFMRMFQSENQGVITPNDGPNPPPQLRAVNGSDS